jgi:hypothetical protein
MTLPIHPQHPLTEASYSELSLLAHCEHKWKAVYVDGLEHETSEKMKLGTILGVCASAYWADGHWGQAFDDLRAGEDSVAEATWDAAKFLMSRYDQHYALEDRPKVVQSEVELKGDFMGTTLVGHVDQLWETPSGKRWLVERKTTGRLKQAEAFQMVSPQVSLYHWLAEENGLEIYGVVTDLIYTYVWKRDAHKHPTSDTCKMIFQDRTDAQVSGALSWARRLVDRKKHLLRMPANTVRNLGYHCDGCIAQEDCWEDLSFPSVRVDFHE